MNIMNSLAPMTRELYPVPDFAIAQMFSAISEEGAAPSEVLAAVVVLTYSNPWVISPDGTASILFGATRISVADHEKIRDYLHSVDFSTDIPLLPVVEKMVKIVDDSEKVVGERHTRLLKILVEMADLEKQNEKLTAQALIENSVEYALLTRKFLTLVARLTGQVRGLLPGYATVKGGAISSKEKHFKPLLDWSPVDSRLSKRTAGLTMLISGTRGGKTTLSGKLVKGTPGVIIVWGEPLNNSEFDDTDHIHRVDTLADAVVLAQVYARLNVPVIIDSLRLSWVAFGGGAVIRGLNADLVWAMTTLNQIMADSMTDVVVMLNPPYVVDDETFVKLEGEGATRNAVVANKQLLHTVATMIRGSVSATVLIENFTPSITDIRIDAATGDERLLVVRGENARADEVFDPNAATLVGPEIMRQKPSEKALDEAAREAFMLGDGDPDTKEYALADEAWDSAFANLDVDEELVDDEFATKDFD